ncbi:MAG: hypothetical protein ACOYJ1_05545 [Peptococcales bacterium]|jgi:hypothetical protein
MLIMVTKDGKVSQHEDTQQIREILEYLLKNDAIACYELIDEESKAQ